MSAIVTHPAGERNKAPILALLRQRLRAGDRVLEIASGPGQHVEALAAALPETRFQPSEPDARMRASIAARAQARQLANVAAPLAIAAQDDWPKETFDAVVVINLVHIVSQAVTERLLESAAGALLPGGLLYLYGPYRVDGRHLSAGNVEFDRVLRERDPESGIRDVEWLIERAADAGFAAPERVAMPANNLSLLFPRAER
ncbi:MAG: DUF938 domain-containing protein [Pseudomonadota bacterium]